MATSPRVHLNLHIADARNLESILTSADVSIDLESAEKLTIRKLKRRLAAFIEDVEEGERERVQTF